MSNYHVTVVDTFSANERHRAGIVVNRVHGYTGELTVEQLEALEADTQLVVSLSEGSQAAEQSEAPTLLRRLTSRRAE